MTDTFKVDNVFIQNAPKTFGGQRPTARRRAKHEGALQFQLPLPGLAPFGAFDEWNVLGLYSLLDPQNPTAPVLTTFTELAETLQFSRVVSTALEGYETFPSETYDMVTESLHRLYSVEVDWRGYWEVKLTDKKGKPTRGRPRKHWVDYKGRILVSFAYIYPTGVTSPALLPATKRRNVNLTQSPNGEPIPLIWREVDGPRPVAVQYQLSPDLVRGLTGENPNIGATILPVRIFTLRKTFGRNPTATKLLVWACRQVKKTPTRTLTGLAAELNLDERQPARSRAALLKGFDMLKDAGVVADWSLSEDKLNVTFTKAEGWYFTRESSKPALTGTAKVVA